MEMPLKNRVLSLVKHRFVIPFIHRCRLYRYPLFRAALGRVLAMAPVSEGTRIRLTRDLLCGVPPKSAQAVSLSSRTAIEPFPMIRVKGSMEDFAASIRLPEHGSPEVSVVIPVHNQIEYTLCCLRSIACHPPKADFEVLVVDDCSTDETARLLPLVRGLRLLRNRENLNFLKSVNLGCGKARGRYLLILNNDTQVAPDWLDALLRVFTLVPGVGLAGSKVVYPSGYLQEAGARMKTDGSAVMIGLNDDPSLPRYNYLREVDYCSGVAMMIPKKLFADLGGLDEHFAPCYYEDADLAYRIRARGWKIIYQPESVVCHHLSVSTGASDQKMVNIHRNRKRFLGRWGETIRRNNSIRTLAFYLPQFHPIPENDEWWGEGFTEWTNVRKARPNFKGHVHPKIPGELGYYDLRDDDVRARQIALAREYGISGFCYYYYWFDGRKLLDTPLRMLLANKSLDFPFCLCWANEDWTRTWDGESSAVLMKQNYSIASYEHFIEDIFPVFADQRYIRINGRPLFMVYRAGRIKECRRALELWRDFCRRHGEKNPYILSVDSFGEAVRGRHIELGFDGIVEFPPHAYSKFYTGPLSMRNPDFSGNLFDYELSARSFMERSTPGGAFFRCAMPGWDNTARRQNNPDVFLGATPEGYERWLRYNVGWTRDFFVGEERITFVNAWNEWAEGNYLEPDQEFGRQYLEATKRALTQDEEAGG